MQAPVAYGIDFGTSNSAIAVAFDDGSVQVLAVPKTITETVIYLHRNANQLTGEDAIRAYLSTSGVRSNCSSCALVDWSAGVANTDCRSFEPAGSCFDARLIAQLKSDVANPAFAQTHSWAHDFNVEMLIAVVLRWLKVRADQQVNSDVQRVTIGHPVRFAGADGPDFRDRQAVGQQRLIGGGRLAGFSEHVGLMEESKAAVAADGVERGVLVCLDFGGGTFDVAVVDVDESRSTVLALNGVAVGGEEFDSKIFEAIVAPSLGLNSEFTLMNGQRRNLPASLRSRLRSLGGINDLKAENLAAGVSSYLSGLGNDEVLRSISSLVNGGASWPMFQAIRRAKHELSTSDASVIDVRSLEFNLQLPLTRHDFNSIIAKDLDRVRYCYQDALEDADVEPDAVDYVALTGGSSQIQAFREMVARDFPVSKFVELNPFTSVVQGLARHAFEEWAT